jgi:O-methyltransferase involved in polyketide biosynthesis
MKANEQFIKDAIGETLLITLYMKCLESRKPDSIITDKIACELVNKIDYDFSKYDKAINSSVGVAIRANYFDEMLQSFIKRTQNAVIVIIGCGLDSRYERIGQFAEKASFYQLDIPEVMQLREQFIPAHKNEIYLSSSMLETQWMDEIKLAHPDGQLVFKNLAERFSNSELLFDIVNIWMSKNSHIHDSVKMTKAKFIFGTDDDKEMESWEENLQHVSTKLFGDFKKFKRVGFIRIMLMKLIPTLKYSGRMLHYKVNSKT